jgi:galactonate dehydratase
VKVVAVETFLVPPRWVFVRVEADDGTVGWGEPVVEGRALTVRAAVEELVPLLLGRDPRDVEAHWQVAAKGTFYRGGPVLSSAVAGLDQALWDLFGKSAGLPVHRLLGGPVRDRVRMYGWVGGDEPEEVVDAALDAVERTGLTAVKMNGSGRHPRLAAPYQIRAVVDRVAAVREALGDERDVCVDFHGRIGPADARRLLRELEPIRPLFVEEPVPPELSSRLKDLTAVSSVPIATGERLYDKQQFHEILHDGVAVVQPDLSHAGGISEVRRIAAVADAFGALLAPHCPLGPLALAASLQVGFATPNFLIQEQSLGIHYHDGAELLDYLVDRRPFALVGGHIERWEAPGLGVEIDERAVRQAARSGHDWHNPVWHHPDGSFAEW